MVQTDRIELPYLSSEDSLFPFHYVCEFAGADDPELELDMPLSCLRGESFCPFELLGQTMESPREFNSDSRFRGPVPFALDDRPKIGGAGLRRSNGHSRLKGPVFYQLNYDPIKLVGAAWIQTRTDLVKGQAYCRLYYAPKKWNRKRGTIPRTPVYLPATTGL